MPSLTDPFVEIEIEQLRGEDTDPLSSSRPALRLNSNELFIQGSIDGASDRDDDVVVLRADIHNLTKEIAEQVQVGGFVRVQGGYQDETFFQTRSRLTPAEGFPIQTMFFGLVDSFLPYRKGPEVIWKLQASTYSTRLTDISVQRSFPGKWTIGDVMQDIVGSINGSISVPLSAIGEDPDLPKSKVQVQNYTSKMSVVEELSTLKSLLEERTNRKYTLHRERDNVYFWELVDTSDVKNTQVIQVNPEETTVYTIAFSPTKDEVEDVEAITSVAKRVQGSNPDRERAINELEDKARKTEVRVTTPMDPRVDLGTWVNVTDEDTKSGVFNVDNVSHRFGGQSWESQYGGIIDPEVEIEI